MKTQLFAFVLALVLVMPLAAQKKEITLAEKATQAVGLLYSQTTDGGMRMHCTVTAIEKTGKGYKFASAAHCIGDDDRGKERSATGENIPFFITHDEAKAAKKFYPARVIFVGYQHRGEDFAEFEIETNDPWETIPLGNEADLQADAPILNVASPLGLGVQIIRGTISSVYLDRPIVQGDINWKGSMMLSIATVDGGSSGSAVISEEQKKIVGFLVGSIGTSVIAIPVSKFKAVEKAFKSNTYKYYKAEDAPAN